MRAESAAARGIGAVAFTVLTPTFNRAHTLERVYRSLCRQSRNDFEWLVVDDGSMDGTRALVERLQTRAPFAIRYIWQPNRHKKAAFNNGVAHARGEWIVAIDSDDELADGALKKMGAIWSEIASADQPRYAGITGLCVRPDGRVIGNRFPRDVMKVENSIEWFCFQPVSFVAAAARYTRFSLEMRHLPRRDPKTRTSSMRSPNR